MHVAGLVDVGNCKHALVRGPVSQVEETGFMLQVSQRSGLQTL